MTTKFKNFKLQIRTILGISKQDHFETLDLMTMMQQLEKLGNSSMVKVKVMVVPYTFICRGVPVREDNYAELLACEVGWPFPFLAAFTSPVFPWETHLLLGEQ